MKLFDQDEKNSLDADIYFGKYLHSNILTIYILFIDSFGIIANELQTRILMLHTTR